MDEEMNMPEMAPDGFRFSPARPTLGMIRTALMRWLGRRGVGPARPGALSGPDRLRDALQAAFDTIPVIDAATAREFGWSLVPARIDPSMVAAAASAIRAESREKQALPPFAIQGIGMQAAVTAAISAGIVSASSVEAARRIRHEDRVKRGDTAHEHHIPGQSRADLDEYDPANI